jgi:uncharacterized protein (DUF2062 family)
MSRSAPIWITIKRKLSLWLFEGISPRRLALTLALGFVLGCLPLVGIPTGLCVVIAVAFRLNLAAIQAANYAAMPFQLALIVPFARLGGRLTPSVPHLAADGAAPAHFPLQIAVLAGQALIAWLVISIPVLIVLTSILTGILRRVPRLASLEAKC